MAIDSAEINIVVQGAVMGGAREPYAKRATARCLDNLRALFPEAEIILSTWAAQETSDLSCDKIVRSADPGGIDFDINEVKGQQRESPDHLHPCRDPGSDAQIWVQGAERSDLWNQHVFGLLWAL